jgi:hypothetical protein
MIGLSRVPQTLALAMMAVWMPVDSCYAEQPSESESQAINNLLAGRFQWRVSQPLFEPFQRPDALVYAIKDPSIVFHEGRWHLFCSVRSNKPYAQMEYLTFKDLKDPQPSKREILRVHSGHCGAPQVFYFRPHERWYLICQATDDSWDPEYGAACATSTNIADPATWSALAPLGHRKADGKSGLDFWVICDDAKAHLFFTTLDGRMWREETSLTDFPAGWSAPVMAIQGDVFEASHVYKLEGLDKYLTVIEAQHGHGSRYFKAYLADRLDGQWIPLAATKDKTFASMANTRPIGERWTDSISHGELIRSGYDERLTVDPANLRFLFQGASNKARAGKPYGQIPWRLGMLDQADDLK